MSAEWSPCKILQKKLSGNYFRYFYFLFHTLSVQIMHYWNLPVVQLHVNFGYPHEELS